MTRMEQYDKGLTRLTGAACDYTGKADEDMHRVLSHMQCAVKEAFWVGRADGQAGIKHDALFAEIRAAEGLVAVAYLAGLEVGETEPLVSGTTKQGEK